MLRHVVKVCGTGISRFAFVSAGNVPFIQTPIQFVFSPQPQYSQASPLFYSKYLEYVYSFIHNMFHYFTVSKPTTARIQLYNKVQIDKLSIQYGGVIMFIRLSRCIRYNIEGFIYYCYLLLSSIRKICLFITVK